MRISKMLLNFSVLAMVAGMSTTASAGITKSEACNKRSEASLFKSTNPKPSVARSEKRVESKSKSTPSGRHKGTRG